MKRIFIAVKIETGEKLQSMISTFRTVLKYENIKWTILENLHITLSFLGDTEDDKIDRIDKMVERVCENSGDFELIIKGAGLFKNLNDPRIVWTGIEPSEKLIQLNALIKTGLKEAGVSIEDRTFSPHMTLGRIKSIRDIDLLKSVLTRYHDLELQKQKVREVIMYESLLQPSGPLYKPISTYRL